MEIFKLFGSILIDNDEANASIAKTEEKAEGVASKFGSGIKTAAKWGAAIVVGAAGAAVAIGAMAAPLIEAAASSAAMDSQFTQVFGDMETNAQNTLNKLGEEFGMLPTRLKPSFTKTTSMLKGFGMSTEEAMSAASTAVTLAADAAAFYDVSLDAADGALTSFLKGNTNAAESIGIFATAAGMADFASAELGLEWKKLDEGGKQLVRLKYVEKMQEAAGATGQAARESSGLENVMGNLRQAWEDLKVKFGAPILEPAVEGIKSLVTAMTEMDVEPIINGIEKFATFVSEKLLPGIASVVTGVGEFVTSSKEKIAEFKDVVMDVLSNFEPLFETVKGAFQNLIESIGPIWETLKTLFESLKPILEMVGILVGGVLVAAFGVAMATFNAVISAIGPLIKAIINIADIVVNMVNVVVAILRGDFAGAWKYLQDIGKSTMEFFKNIFSAIVNYVSTFVKTIIDFFHGLYMTLVGNSIIPDMVNAIVKWFKDMFKWVVDLVKSIVTSVVEKFGELIVSIKGKLTEAKTKIEEIWNSVMEFFRGIDLMQIGKDIIQGLIDGIASMASAVWNIVTGIGDGVKNAIKGVLNIKSPSRVMEDIGEDTGEGFIIGLGNKMDSIKRVALDMADLATPKIGPFTKQAYLSTPSMSSNVPNVVNNYFIDATIDGKTVAVMQKVEEFLTHIKQVSNAYRQ